MEPPKNDDSDAIPDDQALIESQFESRPGARRGAADSTKASTVLYGIFNDDEIRARLAGFELEMPAGTPPPLPRRIGRFEIAGVLGQGGFGVVYLARDPSLGRNVALKVPRPHVLETPDFRERFLREARAAGRLDHPHIVPVYEVGVDGRTCFMSSAYCDGGTLHDWLKAQTQPVPVDLAVKLVVQLADALQHAHNRDVLHRDLKPANVLLASSEISELASTSAPVDLRRGDVPPEPKAGKSPRDDNQTSIATRFGHKPATRNSDDARSGISSLQCATGDTAEANVPTLRIADFGLAKLLDGDDSHTQSGAVFGTPVYMAPEQAESGLKLVDRRCDIYSLGVILYELVTGQRPFSGSQKAIISQVLTEAPPPLRQLRPEIPRDVETVCLKAMARDREQRYATAGDLATDLRRCLAREPIVARRPGVSLGKRLFNRRVVIGLALSFLLLFAYAAWPERSRGAGSNRRVTLATEPAGAAVWFIPLSKVTGEPEPERIVKAGNSPVDVELAPGDYLVEAVLDDQRFHEVYRRVPEADAGVMDGSRYLQWRTKADGSIALPFIQIPAADVSAGMARLEGNEHFAMGRSNSASIPLHYRSIPAFLMDPTEFTYGDYGKLATGNVAVPQPPKGSSEAHALPVDFRKAVTLAEAFGKRLPDESEYEFAATAGGTRSSPGTDDDHVDFAPVGTPAVDRVDLDQRVAIFGLCSNVAEWTTSWVSTYPGTSLGSVLVDVPATLDQRKRRIVRGGSKEVIGGDARVSARTRDPRSRHIETEYFVRPGLGVRFVRSPKPRLTPADFPQIRPAAD